MPEHAKELNDKNFDDFISKGDAVVDFWAEWCGPCKILKPIFQEVASEIKGKTKFGMVDIEKGQETAERFGVMSVPTVIFFKDGEIVERFSGVVEKKKFIEMIKSAF
jgi:thioredoxin 1